MRALTRLVVAALIAGGAVVPAHARRVFAVALDATSNATLVNPGTSITWSHNFGAIADGVLMVGCFDDSGGSTVITGVTVGGNAMTKVADAQAPSDRWVSLWRRAMGSVSAGNQTVIASASASVALKCMASSFAGVDQTTPIDSFDTEVQSEGVSELFAVATDVVASGCWLVGVVKFGAGSSGSLTSSDSTNRHQENGLSLWDTNGTVSTGTQDINWSDTAPFKPAFAGIVASIAPVSGGGGGGSGATPAIINSPVRCCERPISLEERR